jgi:enoyl-CoA hydratase/carnithine racemase
MKCAFDSVCNIVNERLTCQAIRLSLFFLFPFVFFCESSVPISSAAGYARYRLCVAQGTWYFCTVAIRRPAYGYQSFEELKRVAWPSRNQKVSGKGDTPMNYSHITRHREGSTTVITLNWPTRRNALSLELMQELIHCFDSIGEDREVRAVILAAAGTVFCSGHDLSEMVGRNINEYRRLFDVCTALMTRIQSIPQPVIAEVQGVATAAGCQLVATCDLAIASEKAAFATPGVRLGLFCTTPMVALSRAIGRKRALQMLFTGDMVDARTAAEWGLINSVVPADALAGETRKLAERISSASLLTIGLGKQAYYSQIDLDQPKAYAYAKEVMSMNSLALDAQEGISAFLEKRPACWLGR